MSAKIIQIAQLQAAYSGSYSFTVTHEPDPDYRKYLARQLRDVLPQVEDRLPADAIPLDISLDDLEGDVVAGLSAVTHHETLYIDMLWVGEPLRGQGIGRRLMQMAEEQAMDRGCTLARVRVTSAVAFYVGMNYAIAGTVQTVPFRAGGGAPAQAQSIYYLTKTIGW
ncbi:MAG: GNAT family N-acetyltransferase [Chloroflexota bacterium]